MKKAIAKNLNLDYISIVENTFDESKLEKKESIKGREDDENCSYVTFSGIPIFDQLKYTNSTDCNVFDTKNSFSNFKLLGLNSSYSYRSRSYKGSRILITLEGGKEKIIHIDTESVNDILSNSEIKNGIVSSECLFLPKDSLTPIGYKIAVKGGPLHEEFLEDYRKSRGEKTMVANKLEPGSVMNDCSIYIGSCYVVSFGINESGDKILIRNKFQEGVFLNTYYNYRDYYRGTYTYKPEEIKNLLDNNKSIFTRDYKEDPYLYSESFCKKKISYIEGSKPQNFIIKDFSKFYKSNINKIEACLDGRGQNINTRTPYWGYGSRTYDTDYLNRNYLNNYQFYFKSKEDAEWFSEKLTTNFKNSSTGKIELLKGSIDSLDHLWYTLYIKNKLGIKRSKKHYYSTKSIVLYNELLNN